MAKDIDSLVSHCIHCLSTTGGVRVPRRFGPAVHGTKATDLVQFDFIEMALSSTGPKYLLMIRDDFSSYCWLIPFASANEDNSANAILDWATTFGIPSGLMFDEGTHFQNETMRLLSVD